MENIKYIVYTPDLEESAYIINKRKEGAVCTSIIDARSAVYYATGISAQNEETVMVCTGAGNESRSAFSGMTEAYYRRLPIVLVTFGKELDYSRELSDVVLSHYVIDNASDIDGLISYSKPMHIEVRACNCAYESKQSFVSRLTGLATSVKEDDYLYLSSNVALDENFKCKTVHGGMPGSKEGALANVLGASLAKKHKRYIGILTEEEFIHDMNTLGNINANDSLLYIVLCEKQNPLILNYARSLHYEIDVQEKEVFSCEKWTQMLQNSMKTVIEVCKF